MQNTQEFKLTMSNTKQMSNTKNFKITISNTKYTCVRLNKYICYMKIIVVILIGLLLTGCKSTSRCDAYSKTDIRK